MIRRNFDIIVVLALAVILAGAGEFRERVQRAALEQPGFRVMVRPDLEGIGALARIEQRLNRKFETFDRRITERAVRLHERLERLPLCPLNR